MTRRAVITGIGVVSPSGLTTGEHWETITSGRCRIGPITQFDASGYPTTLAGEVPGFDVTGRVDGRLVVQTDRWTWMSFVAAEQALDDASLDLSTMDPYRTSVVMASSSGGNAFGQKELQRLWSDPKRTVGAYQSIAWFYAATVGQLSIRHQAKGPSNVLVSESAGGLDSLSHAARMIDRGVSVVLAGGLEAPLSPYALACQVRSGRLSVGKDPESAYLPYDADASGYVPGEGGAVLVVEELEHALARNAPVIYGEIAGWGATHDGAHTVRGSGGSPRQYERSMRLALERADAAPADVDLLIPDALGVPENDATEASAINEVFGAGGVPLSTQKSLTGRIYQGGAALDVATALLAMDRQVVPASAGTRTPAPGCELAFVPETRQAVVDTAMVSAHGFDGYHSSLVLRRLDRGAMAATGG
ncbi:beta-ketoacyl synthase N-terminal-like domain-containing protein [Amycolatopsis taiwanensis]|uniref:Actinorhodin polyketide putative beta-ketoacyl synthase 2 n=1 Tax=Amycolatopsis taiwanensis TaxID=342230 RepID=A0A9W6VFI6_9PSEU|nr:beta-ketoacyl synthase N-terminal-like domain-containing protein [Amycolatopsis taiwanensis]GLY69653.1 actinorhodin polyketide putative beta-ketoacyl synthase 2 [Amycolatopsis taiwanensis]